MNRFKVIAFTHSNLAIEELALFHLGDEGKSEKLTQLKETLGLEELMYLSTCNRVEIAFVVNELTLDFNFLCTFISAILPELSEEKVNRFAKKTKYWEGINAVNHFIEVASSLDSMVLGEREIITQVRNAYDFSAQEELSGDMIRIVVRQTIMTAKQVYTNTRISEKSVSVVSLAFHELLSHQPKKDARILVVGAGVTNQTLCKFLLKEGYTDFTIFNRSLSNAKKLAEYTNGTAHELKTLASYTGDFDILLSCTASKDEIITPEIYTKLAIHSNNRLLVDLAVPNDINPTIKTNHDATIISVTTLKSISDNNLLSRKKELLKARQIIFDALEEFKSIFQMRQMEIKMRAIPNHVKEIRSKAVSEVFSKEIASMDDESQEVLEKILNYMEKKYISVPMLMAKELAKKQTN